jgi:hypothetical protein
MENHDTGLVGSVGEEGSPGIGNSGSRPRAAGRPCLVWKGLGKQMAFESKEVPADVLKQMLSGFIGNRLGWRPPPTRWIVDDHTGNFLYPTYWGDEENRNSSAYVFSWQQELIGIAVEWSEKVPDGAGKPPKLELTVWRFALPDGAEGFRTGIESEIAAALRCRYAYTQEVEVRFKSQ